MTYDPKPIFDLSKMRVPFGAQETTTKKFVNVKPCAGGRPAGSAAETSPKVLVSNKLSSKLVSIMTPALRNLLQILQENKVMVSRHNGYHRDSYHKDSYHHYMQSDTWMLKSRAMRDYFKTCAVCNSDKHLQVHHKHYETLGHERLEDLTVLCGDHHWEYEKRRKEEKEAEHARKPIMCNEDIAVHD